MDAVFRIIGIIVCGLGGGLLCVAIVWFLGWLVCCVWAAFSNKFRAVCKAESLIFGYRKYHEQFFAWLKLSEEEKWSAAHPRKTRQSVFLEQYPEARIGDDGVLQIHPCSISASHRNARGNCVTMGRKCPDCRREFWMQEVE